MVVMAMDTRTRILPRLYCLEYVNYAYTSSSVGTNETKNSKICNSKSSKKFKMRFTEMKKQYILFLFLEA